MKKFVFIFCFLLGIILSAGIVLAKTTYNMRVPLPGASKASTKLQTDALLSVYTAASIKAPNCNKFSIYDTAILRQPYDLIKKDDKFVSGFWEEQWAVRACGQNVYVPIEFIIEPEGTTFVIENSKVHF